MFRKPLAAIVLLAALALGTASATSLGTFDDVSFAASDVGLLDCEATSELELVPDLDADLALLTSLGIASFPLDEIVVSMPATCIGKTVDVVLAAADGTVLERLTGVTTATGITLDPLGNGLHSITDIAAIEDVRIVVSDPSTA